MSNEQKRRGACCPHPVERHAYNGCANCGCGVRWNEHPDRDLDTSQAGRDALILLASRSGAPSC